MADGIRIEGLPELQKIMQKVGSLQPVKTGLKAGALHVKGTLEKEQPAVSRRPVAQFWTDKQRRGFFANLKAGRIEVPYRRRISPGSEDLLHSWTTQERNAGLTQIVGNDASYGPWVQSEKKIGDVGPQSRYHADTGWKTVERIAREETATVNREVKKIVDAALEGK